VILIGDEQLTLDFDSHELLQQLVHGESEHNLNWMSGDGSYLLHQDFAVPDAPQVSVGRSQEVSADQALDGLSCRNGLSNGNDREEAKVVPWWQEVPVARAASKLAGCEQHNLADMQDTKMVSTDVDCSPTYLKLGVIVVEQLLEEGHSKSTDDWYPTMKLSTRMSERSALLQFVQIAAEVDKGVIFTDVLQQDVVLTIENRVVGDLPMDNMNAEKRCLGSTHAILYGC
jgi:hypothetical protein